MSKLLDIDSHAFAANLGRGAMPLVHALSTHALLTVEAIAELADALPLEKVEHNLGSVPSVLADGEAPRSRLAPGELARGIETNGCWMVLKNIEAVSAYRRLLDSGLDELEPYLAGREGGMRQREGFIFLSAPGSVTPAHIDPEHNLLLQIRGTKEMNVGRFADRATEQRELERFYGGGHRNIHRLPSTPRAFSLGPSDGVYVPPNAPHWVVNGETVSVSLSITFRTPATVRTQRVHSVNAKLRRLRLSPPPPGARPLADRTKATLWGSLQRVRTLV